ncbi:MAG: transglutaminase domain-containing protein [archaeon]
MKRGILLLAAFLVLLPSLSARSIYYLDEMELNIGMSSEMTIKEVSPRAQIDYVSVNLSSLPQDSACQKVMSVETDPDAVVARYVQFYWDKPANPVIGYRLGTRLITSHCLPEVKEKTGFPLKDVSAELRKYTRPSENIDSGREEIISMASGLASGESDQYAVVVKVADWVDKNIAYNLSTLTADASQKASWVLANRYGVCDEISTLFIALLRSVGIPARYVSGIAYTDMEGIEDFGPHGWAEVYFPDAGWVPFDITYSQLGYVDASHVKLQDSEDSRTSYVEYKWLGKYVDIEAKKLSIRTTVVREGRRIEPLLAVSVLPIKKIVGFGSYNLIEARITNPNPYYVATVLSISRSEGLVTQGDERQTALMAPGQEKRHYWIVRVDDSLDTDYSYNFTVQVQTSLNSTGQASFSARKSSPRHTLSETELLMASLRDSENKAYSKEVELLCSGPAMIYKDEPGNLVCSVKNTGNTPLSGLVVCLDDCSSLELGISQKKFVNFSLATQYTGGHEATVTAKNSQVSKVEAFSYTVTELPAIAITALSYPEQVSFNDNFRLAFRLQKKTDAIPETVYVSIRLKNVEQEWELDQLSADRDFVVNLKGSLLKPGPNQIEVSATYRDMLNREYETQESIEISLANISWDQHIVIFFNRIGSGLDQFDLKVMIVAAFAFGIVLGFVLRRGRGR